MIGVGRCRISNNSPAYGEGGNLRCTVCFIANDNASRCADAEGSHPRGGTYPNQRNLRRNRLITAINSACIVACACTYSGTGARRLLFRLPLLLLLLRKLRERPMQRKRDTSANTTTALRIRGRSGSHQQSAALLLHLVHFF